MHQPGDIVDEDGQVIGNVAGGLGQIQVANAIDQPEQPGQVAIRNSLTAADGISAISSTTSSTTLVLLSSSYFMFLHSCVGYGHLAVLPAHGLVPPKAGRSNQLPISIPRFGCVAEGRR
jgi:hypothetical protein